MIFSKLKREGILDTGWMRISLICLGQGFDFFWNSGFTQSKPQVRSDFNLLKNNFIYWQNNNVLGIFCSTQGYLFWVEAKLPSHLFHISTYFLHQHVHWDVPWIHDDKIHGDDLEDIQSSPRHKEIENHDCLSQWLSFILVTVSTKTSHA